MHTTDSQSINIAHFVFKRSYHSCMLISLFIAHSIWLISIPSFFISRVSTRDHIGDTDDMSLQVPTEEPGRIEAYAMKIPPYWTFDPQIWFVQVEAQFTARSITAQGTMYHHVVGSLSPETAPEIRDLLLKSPEDVLNQKLIEHTGASEQGHLQ